MNKTVEYLSSHQSDTPSHWKENAQWRRDNADWLGYAQFITLLVMKSMDEQGVTQKQLAERIGCTQQYVSNLLKGSTNMTLETIARLEKALNIDILKSMLTYKAD
jgi:ribosome-binding protein aMBF1 (putative translation factor)